MNNYEFKVNLYGRMAVTVVAENKEDAQRILSDTIDSITVKDIKDKLSRNEKVEINNSSVISDINEKERGWDRE